MLFTENDRIIKEERPKFTLQAHLDDTNRRIWVFHYSIKDRNYNLFVDYLFQTALRNDFSKIIIPAHEKDVDGLAARDFIPEARAEVFFAGQTAYFMSRYLSDKRRLSSRFPEEEKMLREILQKPQVPKTKPGAQFELRRATRDDIRDLAHLFDRVFETYPTPVNDPGYLKTAMDHGVIFRLAATGDSLAGAAAAEIDRYHKNAEMTDFATLPAYRGRGLAGALLAALEEDCRSMGIKCFYSLTRATSYGMNLVFHRAGYRYRGTMLNNAHIAGNWEDLHLWVKV
ncbi:MAG: putative beta-lysine N-acetyltransferase [Peptococcaceae bacterium]|nr:putative beta-lysine N-acetyltransferase [Peptococcaceae bacterium]